MYLLMTVHLATQRPHERFEMTSCKDLIIFLGKDFLEFVGKMGEIEGLFLHLLYFKRRLLKSLSGPLHLSLSAKQQNGQSA